MHGSMTGAGGEHGWRRCTVQRMLGVPQARERHGGSKAQGLRTSSTMKARMGLRSIVPPRGGMSPRKRFRYGSHSVLQSGQRLARPTTHLRQLQSPCSYSTSWHSSATSTCEQLNLSCTRHRKV